MNTCKLRAQKVNNIAPRVGIQKAFLRTSYDHSFCLSFLCSEIRTHHIRIISWLFNHCAIEAQTLRSLGLPYLNIHCNSNRCYGAYYKTFYGRNCYCIVISQSVSHCHSPPPQSNICGRGQEPKARVEFHKALSKNIRLGQKRMTVVNTLAYYDTETIKSVKSFIVQANGDTSNFNHKMIIISLINFCSVLRTIEPFQPEA